VLLLLVNLVHELLKSILGLESLLLGFARLVSLLLHDDFLLLVRISEIIGRDVESYNVLFDAIYHVIVRTLEHQLKIMLILDHRKFVFCCHDIVGLAEECIFNFVLFFTLLLKFFLKITVILHIRYLELFKFVFPLADKFVDVIVLDSQFAKSRRNLLFLLITCFPRRNVVIGFKQGCGGNILIQERLIVVSNR